MKSESAEELLDIDIYLYKKLDEKAYMRWIHNPVGYFSDLKRFLLICLAEMLQPRNEKWQHYRSKYLPREFSRFSFGFV